jgi:acyl-CoA thioester hydrolase
VIAGGGAGGVGGRDAHHRIELEVRFREVDSYGIVWHGHYLDWMETARHRYGEQYGLGPVQLAERGIQAPVIECQLQFRLPARLGQRVAIEVSAKEDRRRLVFAFDYRILDAATNRLLASATTVQVLANQAGLLLAWPPDLEQVRQAMLARIASPANA